MMEQSVHQTQLTMPQHHHATAMHPSTMHMAAATSNLNQGPSVTGPTVNGCGMIGTTTQAHQNFLANPPLNNASVGNGSSNNNAPCSTLFVANLGQFVSEHDLKEVFSRGPGLESMNDMFCVGKKQERDFKNYQHHHHHQFLMTTPT